MWYDRVTATGGTDDKMHTRGATTCCSCTGTTSAGISASTVTPTSPARDWTSSPPKASCSPGRMPRRHCARRRADRCSPAATRRATDLSGWPTMVGNIARASGRFRRSSPKVVGTRRCSVCSTRRRTRRGWASTSSTCRTRTASTWSNALSNGCETTTRSRPFLLTAGFFETHRPYPRERYEPADPAAVDPPDYLPDTLRSAKISPTSTDPSATADAAVGRMLDTLADTGLDANTWVVFLTDHGAAFPRAKSTLYDAGTGIAMIIRPPTRMAAAPMVYDDLFSGVDLVPTLLELLGVAEPADVEGMSHAKALLRRIAASRCATRCTPARPTTTRSIRSAPSARKNSATSRITRRRPLLDLPWDIEESPSGHAVAPLVTAPRAGTRALRPARRSHRDHNLLAGDGLDGADLIATDLAVRLHDWRQRTNDVIPSDFAGTRIAARYTETYLHIHEQGSDQSFGDRRRPWHRGRSRSDRTVVRCSA